jgi:O-antigen ligase
MATLAVMAAIVAVDPGLLAPYYVPRVALVYPAVLAAAALAVVTARRTGELTLDPVDLLVAGFGLWVVVSGVFSPAPAVAVLGYYNRGAGVVFWLAAVLLLTVVRRTGADRDSRSLVVWVLAATLLLEVAVSLLQLGGLHTPWNRAGLGLTGAVGTTGNPINLAGVSLLGVWMGGVALTGGGLWRGTRTVAAAGAVLGAAGVVLSVTRSAYIAFFLGVAGLGLLLLRSRGWRALLPAAVVLVLFAAGSFIAIGVHGERAQHARSGDGASVIARFASDFSESRTTLWREALRVVPARPLTGVGAGAFVVADRQYRPAADRIPQPWQQVSDPHSAPLLLLSGTGVPGLLLALGAIGAGSVVLVRRLDTGRRCRPGRPTPDAFAPPAIAFGIAMLAFLVVSPVDMAEVFPFMLVLGLGLGAPDRGSRLCWGHRLPGSARARSLVRAGIALVAVAVFGIAVLLGARFFLADRALSTAYATFNAPQARHAASLFPWEPAYQLEAGAQTWRAALDAHDGHMRDSGRAFVERGITLDQSNASGYADLARLELAQGKVPAAVAYLRTGLESNPGHPVLEALWGYAAGYAVTSLHDGDLGARILASLSERPPLSPDGWFWSAATYRALGQTAKADAALTRARQIAPRLSERQYRARLLRGR